MRFGSLVVLADLPPRFQPSGQRKRVVQCLCNCGKLTVVSATHLQSGHTKSCGCEKGDCGRKPTHGHWVDNKPTTEWLSWRAMKNRCYNKNHKDFQNWGARGIIVCDRWLSSFENFIEDMGMKPTPKHSIDRIDNDGNYEPGNCRWATAKEQRANQRTRRKTHANSAS